MVLGMLLDLDPLSYLLPQLLSPFPPVVRVLLLLALGIFHAYEMVRIFFFTCSIFIYLFQLVASGLGMATSFVPGKGNTAYILKWVKCYKRVGVSVGIIRPLLVRIVLFMLLVVMVFIIILLYVVIRMRRIMDQATIALLLGALLIISFVTSIIWEFAAEIHGQTRELLRKLASAEAVCSFDSKWGTWSVAGVDSGVPEVGMTVVKRVRMMKLYPRMVKALQPIGIPLGLWSTTFFLATRSTKTESYKLLADWTLNVLLVYV